MKKINLLICMLLFTTLATSQTTYFIETFEGDQAEGWTFEELWTVDDLESLPGIIGGSFYRSRVLGFDDFSAGADHVGSGRAITPLIDLTDAVTPLYFEALVSFKNADQFGIDEQFKMLISEDNGTTWEEFYDFGDDKPNWTKQIFDFDKYAGKSILVAFDYSDGGAYNIGAGIDDIAIGNELSFSKPLEYTLTIDGGAMFAECAQNVDYEVSGLVLNYGTENIESFDILVESSQETKTYSFDANISTDGVYRYDLPEKINTGTSSSDYTISIANINGSTDVDEETSDNSWDLSFDPVATAPGKGILLEEGTGTWCGLCPRGTVYLQEISKRFGSQVTNVAVHNFDPMELEEYADALLDEGIVGYPSVLFNRGDVLDPDAIVAPIIEELSIPAIAGIDVKTSKNVNNLNTSVKVTFNEDVSNADYNVSVIITENGVTGSGELWEQTNGYSESVVHIGGFEFLSKSVSTEYWAFDHVGRALIGTYKGENEVIGDFSTGATVTHSFDTYSIPLSWDKDELNIIAVLTDENGEVINIISKSYDDALSSNFTTSTNEIVDAVTINVYPNPTSSMVTIDLNTKESVTGTLQVLNSLGQPVITQQLDKINGNQPIQLDLGNMNKGLYIFKLDYNNTSVNKVITVQ